VSGKGRPVNQRSYDLATLPPRRAAGAATRQPHLPLTPDGKHVAIFFMEVQDRLLRPLIAADTR